MIHSLQQFPFDIPIFFLGLDCAYKRKHVVYVLLSLSYFTYHNFPFHQIPCNDIISPFYKAPCVYISHFPHPFITCWAFKLFDLYCNQHGCAKHVYDMLSSVPYLGVASLDHMALLFLVSWGTSILISTVSVLVYIPINIVKGLHFPCVLVSIYFFLNDFHSDWGDIEPLILSC
jgi:hypothetical protein